MNSRNIFSRRIRKHMSTCGLASCLAFALLGVAQALVEITRTPAEGRRTHQGGGEHVRDDVEYMIRGSARLIGRCRSAVIDSRAFGRISRSAPHIGLEFGTIHRAGGLDSEQSHRGGGRAAGVPRRVVHDTGRTEVETSCEATISVAGGSRPSD